MIGFERERRLVLLFLAEALEPLNRAPAVSAVLPLARRPPCELGGVGRALQRLARGQQCIDIHAVVDLRLSHRLLLADKYGRGKPASPEVSDHTSRVPAELPDSALRASSRSRRSLGRGG